jgi:hemoglobin
MPIRLQDPRRVASLLAASAFCAALSAFAGGCGPSKPAVDPEPAVIEPAPPPPPPPPPPAPSLYERLGKREALDAIVDELMGNVLADNRISRLFDKAKKDKERAKQLHGRMVAELCVLAGGAGADCAYDGKPMKDAHKGMNVTEAQWNAFIEDLTIALKTRNVDDALAKELVDKLDSATRADIVTGGKGK